MLTIGSGSKLTFIEVLTVNNYKITFLSNILLGGLAGPLGVKSALAAIAASSSVDS
jgi:hypothetical protein